MGDKVNILDHGYLRFVEAWGHGDAGLFGHDSNDYECGIIEAARQSTQGSFRGWEDKVCPNCKGSKIVNWPSEDGGSPDLVCSKCEGKGYLPGDERLLRYLNANRHATPFEFSGMVIEVNAPIAVFREWHRHRTQSYNEMSARYAPLPDLNYIPTVERLMMHSGKNKQASSIAGVAPLTELDAIQERIDLEEDYRQDELSYQRALKRGVPKELARLRLPVGRYSQMRASTCLRNWLAFLTLRMDLQAQWEIRQYANAIGDLIAVTFPRTWKLFCLGR